MASAIEILQHAKALLERPDRWCQGARARDIEGAPVSPYSPRARSFCILGALERGSAAHEWDMDALREAHALVRNVVYEWYPGVRLLCVWNDAPHRHRLDVLDVLTRAIELAGAHTGKEEAHVQA